MSVTIGTFERRTDKQKRSFWNLEMNLPFHPSADFFCVENGRKEKENQPDFLIWHKGNQVGALWKKVSKNAENPVDYLSGNIYAPGIALSVDSMLWFSVFRRDEEGKESRNVVVIDNKPREKKDHAAPEYSEADAESAMASRGW